MSPFECMANFFERGGSMPRFFLDADTLSRGILTGEDAKHIGRSLRMKTGDTLSLCDGKGTDYDAVITALTPEDVQFRITETRPCPAEPTLLVTLFQAYPKADKFESIVQKSVELGVHEIFPVLTERCVARPDAKSGQKKQERFQKIALEAAKQSGRGIVPRVGPFLTLSAVCEACHTFERFYLLYESGGEPFSRVLPADLRSAALLIGPEGGFAPEEVALIRTAGGEVVTLGKRILRTETAPVAALSILQYATGNLA